MPEPGSWFWATGTSSQERDCWGASMGHPNVVDEML